MKKCELRVYTLKKVTCSIKNIKYLYITKYNIKIK